MNVSLIYLQGKVEFSGSQVPNIVRIMSEGAGSDAKVYVKDMRQQVIMADSSMLVGKNSDQSSIVAVKCKSCK